MMLRFSFSFSSASEREISEEREKVVVTQTSQDLKRREGKLDVLTTFFATFFTVCLVMIN